MSAHVSEDNKDLFGFWIYIMSDCLLFAALFATYVVLKDGMHSTLPAKQLFSMPYVLTETLILLTSSFTYGISMLHMRKHDKKGCLFFLCTTFLLGAAFIGMELNEFYHLAKDGHYWHKSAPLSAFFTLVGTHGLHVTAGLIWMFFSIVKIAIYGTTEKNNGTMSCLGLFWHFLDVIWIFVFTVVYLMGAI